MLSIIFLLYSIIRLSAASPAVSPLRLVTAAEDRNSSVNSTSAVALNSNPNAIQIHCNGDVYRRNLRESSCVDALQEIPQSLARAVVGARGGPIQFAVDLPFRWISDDGLCVFDIYIPHHDTVDEASMSEFHDAAFNLVHNCISGSGTPVGGVATGIGRYRRLGLIMTSYQPTVRCDAAVGPAPTDCLDILMDMPATTTAQVFGRAGEAGVQVQLPYQLRNDDGTCLVTVETTGSASFLGWYDVWENLVAVEGMCARDERYGTAYALGSRRNVFVHMRGGTASQTATS
ncbi:MAG: hypothetical protein Q9191_001052 [Dirinaria sp. TL-2023a]